MRPPPKRGSQKPNKPFAPSRSSCKQDQIEMNYFVLSGNTSKGARTPQNKPRI